MGKTVAFLLYWPGWLLLFAIGVALGVWHYRRSLGREKRMERAHQRRVAHGWPFEL